MGSHSFFLKKDNIFFVMCSDHKKVTFQARHRLICFIFIIKYTRNVLFLQTIVKQ